MIFIANETQPNSKFILKEIDKLIFLRDNDKDSSIQKLSELV